MSNVIKYISRYREKHPDAPETDIRKVLWYVEELLQIIEEKSQASA